MSYADMLKLIDLLADQIQKLWEYRKLCGEDVTNNEA